MMTAALVAAAIVWSHFAFGAVYAWSAPPLLILALAALVASRGWPNPQRLVDGALLSVLLVMLLQLVPLPPAVQHTLSPAAAAFRSAVDLGARPGAWHPLSLDPAATVVSIAGFAAALCLFFATRRIASTQGRTLTQWIAWVAMAAALLGISSRTLFPDGRVYGFWQPLESGAAPFGAIINRNHYAAWSIVALAVAAGALVALIARRSDGASRGRRVGTVLSDGRVLWLLFAVALAGASIVVTASRGASAGLFVSGAAFLAMAWWRAGGRAVAGFGIVAAICLTAALMWARPDRLLTRIGTSESGIGLRAEIWSETVRIAAQYPVAGVGAGAFPAAMTHYQRDRTVFFNHAHNQYLEILVEGGWLLSLPLALALAGIAMAASRGLAGDRGSFVWIRAGAVAALAGLAVLSIWESPFRTPATLMIAAVAAGLASAPPHR